MTYYPSCLNQDEYCKLCNLAQLTPDGCTSTSVANSASKTKPACSTYCNTGCNSECNQPQTVCVIMGQYIKDHADVGGYNGGIINKDDFIHEKWTADYWNTLISKLNTAERVGRLSSHGSGGSVTAGIGAPYFDEHSAEIMDTGRILLPYPIAKKPRFIAPPKYFQKLIADRFPERWELIKQKLIKKIKRRTR